MRPSNSMRWPMVLVLHFILLLIVAILPLVKGLIEPSSFEVRSSSGDAKVIIHTNFPWLTYSQLSLIEQTSFLSDIASRIANDLQVPTSRLTNFQLSEGPITQELVIATPKAIKWRTFHTKRATSVMRRLLAATTPIATLQLSFTILPSSSTDAISSASSTAARLGSVIVQNAQDLTSPISLPTTGNQHHQHSFMYHILETVDHNRSDATISGTTSAGDHSTSQSATLAWWIILLICIGCVIVVISIIVCIVKRVLCC